MNVCIVLCVLHCLYVCMHVCIYWCMHVCMHVFMSYGPTMVDLIVLIWTSAEIQRQEPMAFVHRSIHLQAMNSDWLRWHSEFPTKLRSRCLHTQNPLLLHQNSVKKLSTSQAMHGCTLFNPSLLNGASLILTVAHMIWSYTHLYVCL